MNELYLSLGTNIGNTVANMHRALLSLSQLPKTGPLTVSSGWITAPVDAPPQNDFLNLCCSVEIDCQPEIFHRYTKQLEAEFGRVKTEHNGPRIIDIDLLFLSSGETIRTETLLIPHPRLFERAFVLAPLLEIYKNETLFGRRLDDCLKTALKTQRIEKLNRPLFGCLLNQFVNHAL